jgi:hypothetical protein
MQVITKDTHTWTKYTEDTNTSHHQSAEAALVFACWDITRCKPIKSHMNYYIHVHKHCLQ